MRAVLVAVMALALVLSGCNKSKGMQSRAAVQAAIEQHLQKQSNVMLSNMNVEVEDVKFDADRANASVNFRSKQSPGLVVARHYVLKKVGDQWQVESSSSPGGMGGPHGGGMPAQPSTPEGMVNPHGGGMPGQPNPHSAPPAAPQASH
jgi:hypothetical protein